MDFNTKYFLRPGEDVPKPAAVPQTSNAKKITSKVSNALNNIIPKKKDTKDKVVRAKNEIASSGKLAEESQLVKVAAPQVKSQMKQLPQKNQKADLSSSGDRSENEVSSAPSSIRKRSDSSSHYTLMPTLDEENI